LHNFGEHGDPAEMRRMVYWAFDLGITHFDLANNYGPPPGQAEAAFGEILRHLPRSIVRHRQGQGHRRPLQTPAIVGNPREGCAGAGKAVSEGGGEGVGHAGLS
jgi:hypothetical protein